ncbi:MAG: hypothetical protein AAFR52_00050 [Pseudomonadota bacterium]
MADAFRASDARRSGLSLSKSRRIAKLGKKDRTSALALVGSVAVCVAGLASVVEWPVPQQAGESASEAATQAVASGPAATSDAPGAEVAAAGAVPSQDRGGEAGATGVARVPRPSTAGGVAAVAPRDAAGADDAAPAGTRPVTFGQTAGISALRMPPAPLETAPLPPSFGAGPTTFGAGPVPPSGPADPPGATAEAAAPAATAATTTEDTATATTPTEGDPASTQADTATETATETANDTATDMAAAIAIAVAVVPDCASVGPGAKRFLPYAAGDGAPSEAEIGEAIRFVADAMACGMDRVTVTASAPEGSSGLASAIEGLERSNALIGRLAGAGIDASRLEARADTSATRSDGARGVLLHIDNGGT